MTSREKFEAWMTAEQWFHGSDFEWDERRNCYAQFGIHLAYKAFLAAEGAAEQKLTDMAVQLANAESKCRELAAENAHARERHIFIRALAVSILEHSGGRMDWRGAMEDATELLQTVDSVYAKTPATDAFLAEVRASCVESAINTVIAMMNHQHPVTSKAIDILRVHAAQLRKGAAL